MNTVVEVTGQTFRFIRSIQINAAGIIDEQCVTGPVTNIFRGTSLDFTEGPNLYKKDDRYYLIVPTDGVQEGSYGRDSAGAERPQGGGACHDGQTVTCP